MELDRRRFLQGSAGLTLYFLSPLTRAATPTGEAGPPPFRPNSRLTIDPSGGIHVHIEKAEMGQGIEVALSQMVAEELEARWEDVSASLNTYTSDQGFVFTASSLSVFTSFDSVSRAAAAARLRLIDTIAEHWGVDPETCTAADSTVRCGDRQATFGEIVSLRPSTATVSPEDLQAIELKKPSEYRIVGKGQPSPRYRDKARGKLMYGIDHTLPGMVFAKVAYPPALGDTARAVDDSSAKQVHGYLQTVVNEHVVAVVADSYTAAVACRDALQIEWSPGPLSRVDSAEIWTTYEGMVDTESGRDWVRQGDATAALGKASRTFSQDYTTDIVAHLQMEPFNCTAEYRSGEIHLYSGTQYPTRLANQISEMCGVDLSKVFVHGQYSGGGFGALLETEWHVHAALIAKEIGKPVKLILSREEDTANDAFRTPSYQRLTGGLDEQGRISGWEHRIVSAWPSSRHRVFLDSQGFDSYALSGGDHHYAIDDQTVLAIEQDLGVPVGYVRGVACGYTFFAIESFIDELAHQAGRDPLEMRQSLLKERPRLAHVLGRAAELGGWGQKTPARTGLGLSVMTGQDSHANTTRVGCLVRAHVGTANTIRVEKVSCVVDCGLVINPNGALAMAEGALLYGLSIALMGGATLENGRVRQRNFDTYPVLRMEDVPELEIEFVPSEEPPTGMGEPTTGCVAPALANAVFAATGRRVRSLPMTPERLKLATAG